MKKALIIGADGFVGRYLEAELLSSGYEVVASTLSGSVSCDVLDPEHVNAIVLDNRPDAIFYLVAQSSVAKSWQNPDLTFDINIKGALHLLESLRLADWSVRTLFVGSSDQYGKASVGEDSLISEDMPLAPATPYAISKCTQEALCRLYADVYGLDLVLTRSFNHIGIGQRLGFVVPDLIHEILDVEFGLKEKTRVGNLSAKRDFTDVRDVVRAYRLLMERGQRGQVYNVGSGRIRSIEEIFAYLCSISLVDIQVEIAQEKMRPSDIRSMGCDASRLTRDTGWTPAIPLETTLSEMMDDSRAKRKELADHE